ncbi:hypothetical protein AAY473_003875 [Plecturocebus cupreus]
MQGELPAATAGRFVPSLGRDHDVNPQRGEPAPERRQRHQSEELPDGVLESDDDEDEDDEVQCLMPIIPVLWEAKANGSPEKWTLGLKEFQGPYMAPNPTSFIPPLLPTGFQSRDS